jgi:hypothetical protein
VKRRSKRPVYNEPLLARRGDVIPRIRNVGRRGIDATVRCRLTLEQNLRLCGLSKSTPRLAATAQVKTILLAMLDETDSPVSASLRARATALAGTLGVKSAAPVLGRIAADETEDLATRMGAVHSYFQLSEGAATAALRKILASKVWQVRAYAYRAAMNGKSTALRASAAKRFEAERDDRVAAYVSRFVPAILAEQATRTDAS